MVAQAQLAGERVGVHDVESGLLFSQAPLHGGGQVLLQRLLVPFAVQQEGTALFQLGHDIVFIKIVLIVAGHEIRLLHQIAGEDGRMAEAQVGFGDAEALFGVVFEVGLGVHIGVVADDLHRVLVGAHGAVGA